MKYIVLFISFLLILNISFSQIKAITGNGDEVILSPDGTWKYANINIQNQNKIDTNKLSFTKSLNATFIVNSNKVSCGVYIDPKKWSFAKSSADDESEFNFTLKAKDAYALLLPEKTEVPLESLGAIALENAQKVSPDIKVTKKEYRKVNGQVVLMMQMNGTIKGIKVTFIGYYFSAPGCSVQLLTYSGDNLFEENKKEMEQFLNGFTYIKK